MKKKNLFILVLVSLFILTITSAFADGMDMRLFRYDEKGNRIDRKFSFVNIIGWCPHWWTQFRDGWDENNYHKNTPYIFKDGHYYFSDLSTHDFTSFDAKSDYLTLQYVFVEVLGMNRADVVVTQEACWVNGEKKTRTSLWFLNHCTCQFYEGDKAYDYQIESVRIR